MEESLFWRYKIVQFFHDPPAKPYASWPGLGGHRKVAADLFQLFTKQTLKGYPRQPDWAAAGADRPLISTPRLKGVSPVGVHWPTHPVLTHALSPGWSLDFRLSGQDHPSARGAAVKELMDDQQELAEEQALDEWGELDQMRAGFWKLWRSFRDELVYSKDPDHPEILRQDLLWAEMPADSRCPDHSIWDHLRVTTALAFISAAQKSLTHDAPRSPWLWRFAIGPVQRFIEESRTARDLWMSSFLLSDLIWHAMEPVVERYGPDCILYPDLRGNPRIDVWLKEKRSDCLPEIWTDPSTFAAMLPNVFVALVPRGGEGHLRRLEDLAKEAEAGYQDRWEKLRELVRDWMSAKLAPGKWEGTWARQTKHPLHSSWVAVPWLRMESIRDAESLRSRALPAQRPGFREPSRAMREDRLNIQARRNRLEAWVPKDAWVAYEWAREVYAFTNLAYHQMERGFDYALTHHQLNMRHALRKETAPDSPQALADEPGEKCTLCGKRTALGGEPSGGGIDSTRRSCGKFWKKLDPDETGSERLCSVCSVKRFLVEAGGDKLEGVNRTWAGFGRIEDVLDDDGKIRVPFPSAATLASQLFLEKIAEDPEMSRWLEAVNRAHEASKQPKTSFARALPRLAAVARDGGSVVRDFLKREAQETIFPDAIEGVLRFLENHDGDTRTIAFKELLKASQDLTRAADQRRHGRPGTRIAAIVVDGDHLHRLLLGDPEKIASRWRDVIHPEAVKSIQQNAYLSEAGWLDLLDAKRLMGPSLHAFVSRALATFSHRIVPWVVEREYSGRLIYAGGDDVLCLAPAADALGIAARLQQLFSSPWVIDTRHAADTWAWRRRSWKGEFDQSVARGRFLIPKKPPEGQAIRLPLRLEDLEGHVQAPDITLPTETNGAWLPLLGSGASLSAGIAYGHFKSPLGVLIGQARKILKDLAKGRAGRGAVALSHFSRNGVKTEFAMPWNGRNGGRSGALECLTRVVDGFQNDALPGRLPYKLRLLAPMVRVAEECLDRSTDLSKDEKDAYRNSLLHGLFQEALDVGAAGGQRQERRLFSNAFTLWDQGIHLFPDAPERFVDGLLVCRYLSDGEGLTNE